MSDLRFSDLALATSVQNAVRQEGYLHPTPIQAEAIPELIAGRDVLATAQTGTGKTAAFVLPLVHHLLGRRPDTKGPEALILCPTRELAVQIGEAFTRYGAGSAVRHSVLFGGAPKPTQIRSLRARPRVVIATPGRLLDLINERYLTLDRVQFLVLDEADRMLDMGFIPDVRRICSMVNAERQTALFSATMPDEIASLAASIMQNPTRIAVASDSVAVDRIDQTVLHVDQENKLQLLTELIQGRGMYRAIVFTRTKHRSSRVAKALNKAGITSDAIHGDKTQNARQRALDSFRRGRIQVLVATDVASRGIDVDDVTHVVNFEIPNEPETYVHRIGRTARAGADGIAISLCTRDELSSLRAIERLIEAPIPVDIDHAYHVEPPRPAAGRSGNTRAGNAHAGNAHAGRPGNNRPQGTRAARPAHRPYGDDSRRHDGPHPDGTRPERRDGNHHAGPRPERREPNREQGRRPGRAARPARHATSSRPQY